MNRTRSQRTRFGFVLTLLALVGVVVPSSRASAAILSPTTYGFSCAAGSSSENLTATFSSLGTISITVQCYVNPQPGQSGYDTWLTGLVNGTVNSSARFNVVYGSNQTTSLNLGGTRTGLIHGKLSGHAGDTIANATDSDYRDNWFQVTLNLNAYSNSAVMHRGVPQLVGVGNPWFGSTSFSPTVTWNSYLCNAGVTTWAPATCIDADNFATAWPTVEPDRWESNASTPTCQTIGFEVETRVPGATVWSAVDEHDELEFLQPLRLTMNLPSGSARLNSLLVAYSGGPTPIQTVAIHPYGIPYRLTAYWSLTESDPHFVENIGILNKAVFWFVRPGFAETQTDPPLTVVKQWAHSGSSGTSLSDTGLKVMCQLQGDPGYSVMNIDGTTPTSSILDQSNGCDAVRVVQRSGTETEWRWRVTKTPSTTNLVGVEVRYDGGTWEAFYTPTAPTSDAFQADVTLSRETYPIRSLFEFRATCNVPGGPDATRTFGETPAAGGLGPDDGGGLTLADCYGPDNLGSMQLTSPISWLTGLGKMGACIVQWLVVPQTMQSDFEQFVAELETQFPFSLGFVFIEFAGTLADELETASGSGCFSLGSSWSFGTAGDVDADDVCIGDGLTVSSTQRNLIATVIIGPMIYAFAQHFLSLINPKTQTYYVNHDNGSRL